jgi:hypothetical protein
VDGEWTVPVGRWSRRPADLGPSLLVFVACHVLALGLSAILLAAGGGWGLGGCGPQNLHCLVSEDSLTRYLVVNLGPFAVAFSVLAGGCTLATVRYRRTPLAAGLIAAAAGLGIAVLFVAPFVLGRV